MGGQRRVGQDAAEGADAGVAHHATLQRENAAGAQPFGILLRHLHDDAYLTRVCQLDALHPANRKT